MVVNPADMPTTDNEKVQNEDASDSRKIARSLSNGDLKPIHVPSLKTFEDRALVRTRSTLVTDLFRNKNRIKSFLHLHGIEIPEQFAKTWSKKFMNGLDKINMSEKSGKYSLVAIITSSKNLRDSIL